MKYAADFRSIARNALSGRWAIAVITGLIASLLGAVASNGPEIKFNIGDNGANVGLEFAGPYNSLNEDKTAMIVLAFVGAAFLIIIQVWVVDSVVSYHRGRGFLAGHGYHVHTYGRSNPHYIRAGDRYNATHAGRSGGRSGGRCACACACACAGGGRAGCSQKDTYGNADIRENNAVD